MEGSSLATVVRSVQTSQGLLRGEGEEGLRTTTPLDLGRRVVVVPLVSEILQNATRPPLVLPNKSLLTCVWIYTSIRTCMEERARGGAHAKLRARGPALVDGVPLILKGKAGFFNLQRLLETPKTRGDSGQWRRVSWDSPFHLDYPGIVRGLPCRHQNLIILELSGSSGIILG